MLGWLTVLLDRGRATAPASGRPIPVSRARAVSGTPSWTWRRMSSHRSDIRRTEPSRPCRVMSWPVQPSGDSAARCLRCWPGQPAGPKSGRSCAADAEDVADLADGELLLVVQPSGGLDLVVGQLGRAATTPATSADRCQTPGVRCGRLRAVFSWPPHPPRPRAICALVASVYRLFATRRPCRRSVLDRLPYSWEVGRTNTTSLSVVPHARHLPRVPDPCSATRDRCWVRVRAAFPA